MDTEERPYGHILEDLMAEKTRVLSQAHAFSQMGLAETAESLWRTAASLEERIAPHLDAIGRGREAALHRVSAATCYRQAGELSRAVNLYQAALAGPLRDASRSEVERFLGSCLAELDSSPRRQTTAAT